MRKHFRRELDIALAEASARIAEKLYDKALAGDVTAMIFWLKARAKWSERITVTPDVDAELDLASMSDAEIEARIARLRRRTLRD